MEWDNEGVDLITSTDHSHLDSMYNIDLGRVHNLDSLLPLPPSIQDLSVQASRSLPDLRDVADSNAPLPMSPAPLPQSLRSWLFHRSSSTPPTSIPFFSNFLRRLNPFKKKRP